MADGPDPRAVPSPPAAAPGLHGWIGTITGVLGLVSLPFTLLFFFRPDLATDLRADLVTRAGLATDVVAFTTCAALPEAALDDGTAEIVDEGVFDVERRRTIADLDALVGVPLRFDIEGRRVYRDSADFSLRTTAALADRNDVFHVRGWGHRACRGAGRDGQRIVYLTGLHDPR